MKLRNVGTTVGAGRTMSNGLVPGRVGRPALKRTGESGYFACVTIRIEPVGRGNGIVLVPVASGSPVPKG